MIPIVLSISKSLDVSDIEKILTPIDKALGHLDKFIVEDNLYHKLINGNVLKLNLHNMEKVNKNFRIYCNNEFIGIGRIIPNDSAFLLKNG